MYKKYKYFSFFRLLVFILCCSLLFPSNILVVHATTEDFLEEAEERKNDPVESNEVENWPDGPAIGAEAAILMNADTGAILYAKNIDAAMYPASTTKIMTCLVAVENCPLNEIITVSQSAIDANASDGSNMGLTAGERFTLEELLYGILINSANEACNAVAEHVAGSIDGYVEMMNQRAAELGCTNTHFVTTNGLHDENHYTSAHDLAIIASEFYSHDVLSRLSCISIHNISANGLHEEHSLYSHNRLYEGREYEYEYLIGSKTGFTSNSRQTLVSCAEKDGVRLVCVILKEESPYQFEDTVALFDYGFSNFSPLRVADYETSYEVSHADFFDSHAGSSSDGIFGSTAPLISIDKNATILVPNGISFSDLTSSINYEVTDESAFAKIDYFYNSMYLGSSNIMFASDASPEFSFSDTTMEEDAKTDEEAKAAENQIILDINKLLTNIILSGVVIIVLFIVLGILKNYHFERKRVSQIKKRRQSSYSKRRPPVRRTKKPMPQRHNTNRENSNGFSKRRKKPYRKPLIRTLVHPDERKQKNDNTLPKKRNDINFKDFEI